MLGAVTTLACYIIALLLLVIHYWRQLTVLDKWLQGKQSTLPDGPADGEMYLHA